MMPQVRRPGAGMVVRSALAVLALLMIGCGDSSDTNDDGGSASLVFVQTGSSGSFTGAAGVGDRSVLTLQGVSPSTIWFADLPSKRTGADSTERIVRNFSTDFTPRAVLEIPEDGAVRVVVFRILNFDYDAAAAVLRCEVSPLSGDAATLMPAYFSPNLNQEITTAVPAEVVDGSLPAQFGPHRLFIDSSTSAARRLPFSCKLEGCGPDVSCPVADGKCYLWNSLFMCCRESPYG